MTLQALIVGGGMGGLAAAVSCARAGWLARLYEQAPAFSEVGAGIQLGPNSTRILKQWGLLSALAKVAAVPRQLRVRRAVDGNDLGVLRLGEVIAQRYGAPYLTMHRSDLQQLLLAAAREAGTEPRLGARAVAIFPSADSVALRIHDQDEVEGDVLVGADGLWSQVRSQVWRDGLPTSTGHLAYRGVVAQADLPAALRSQDINVWLGPHIHLVAYPVRGGDQLNVVAIVEGGARERPQDWDHAAAVAELRAAMGGLCTPLQDLVQSMPHWRLWVLHDRPPVASADEMARDRIALLGDAAHPMRPYFAQGAGMAIEDAFELGRALSSVPGAGIEVPLALRRYARNRWQRCARVQGLSLRNGRIFHATGIVRWGRDLSLRVLGERVLDQPWLYGR